MIITVILVLPLGEIRILARHTFKTNRLGYGIYVSVGIYFTNNLYLMNLQNLFAYVPVFKEPQSVEF